MKKAITNTFRYINRVQTRKGHQLSQLPLKLSYPHHMRYNNWE
jgi:hypothetical protein